MHNERLNLIRGSILAAMIIAAIFYAISAEVKSERMTTEEPVPVFAPATAAPTEPETEPTEAETAPETTAPTEPFKETSPTEEPATEATEPPTEPRETEPHTETTPPETEPASATEPAVEPTTEPAEEWKSIGKYTLTAYCSCQKCCGQYAMNRPLDENGNPIVYTSIGAVAQAGVTIAVDPRVIPYGTEVKINDHIYIAQDTGGNIKGARIDVYFDDHQEALHFGCQTAEVLIRA